MIRRCTVLWITYLSRFVFHPPAFPARKMLRFVLLLEIACVGYVPQECDMHSPRPRRLFVHTLRSNLDITMSSRETKIIDAVHEMWHVHTSERSSWPVAYTRRSWVEDIGSGTDRATRLRSPQGSATELPSGVISFCFCSSLSWSPLVRYFDWHNIFFLEAIPRIARVVALIFPPFRCRASRLRTLLAAVDSTWTASR